MAKGKLTERQQEIKGLLDEGKSPREVAEILSITESAVYHQQRRIRKATGTRRPGTKRSTAKRSTGRRAATRPKLGGGSRPGAGAVVEAAGSNHSDHIATPLQAIRARKADVQSTIRTREGELEHARRALRDAEEAYDAAKTKIADEIARLTAAENALTGATPKRTRRSNNSKSAQTPAPAAQATPAPTPEPGPAPAATAETDREDTSPVKPPPDREAELAGVAQEHDDSPVEEERPGVPVDPDFERPEGDEAAALVGAEEGGFEQAGSDEFE